MEEEAMEDQVEVVAVHTHGLQLILILIMKMESIGQGIQQGGILIQEDLMEALDILEETVVVKSFLVKMELMVDSNI